MQLSTFRKKSTLIGLGVFFGVAVVLIIIAGLIAMFNNNDSINKKSDFLVCHNCPPLPQANSSEYQVDVNFVAFDPILGVLKMSVRVLDAVNQPTGALLSPVRVNINDKSLDFKPAASTLMSSPQEISISVSDYQANQTSSDPTFYPLDQYSSIIGVFMQSGNSTAADTPKITVVYLGSISGFTIKAENLTSLSDFSSISDFYSPISFSIKRSTPVIFFSIFICILQWALALSLAAVTSTIWIRNRKVEPPIIAVSTAMLFALPALRNAQPYTPAVGTSSDLASFYWAMSINSICVVLLLLNYTVKYKRDKPSAPAVSSANAQTTLLVKP